jgi:hypothetical protein
VTTRSFLFLLVSNHYTFFFSSYFSLCISLLLFPLCREFEKSLKESSLQRLLQDATDEEGFDGEGTGPLAVPSTTKRDDASNNFYSTISHNHANENKEDIGRFIHHYILAANYIKSCEVCLLGLYSCFVSVSSLSCFLMFLIDFVFLLFRYISSRFVWRCSSSLSIPSIVNLLVLFCLCVWVASVSS